MNKYSTLLLFIAFFVLIQAKAQWHWEHPIPQGNNLNELYFINSTGYAVGDYGTILTTPHRDSVWTMVDSLSISSDLNSVYFTDENTGTTCWERNII